MKRLSFLTGLALLAVVLVVASLWISDTEAKTAARVLFTDDFESGNDNQWYREAGTNWSVVLDGANHVYSYTTPGPTYARSIITETAVPGSTSWTDYVVQAKVKLTDGTSAMLIARYQDPRNYYFMNVRGDNDRVEIKKYINASSTTMGTADGAVPGALGTWYTATLEVNGNVVRAYINGTLVLSRTDVSYGGVGPFLTGTMGIGTQFGSALFDDVIVTDLRVFTLAVTRTGTGNGLVTSPAGINCGDTCSAVLDSGTVVTLTATPSIGSDFAGWMGAGCGGIGECIVTMDAAKSVMAVFSTPSNPMLLVNKAGNGSGSVASVPAGIDCGLTCTAGFTQNTPVTLTATATPGTFSEFVNWSGACTGSGPCVLNMDAVKNVTATFRLAALPVSVGKIGNGTGSVASVPAGIDCGVSCTASYEYGTVITLTATPAGDSVFSGWSGGASGATNPVLVTVDNVKFITATFMSLTQTLTVGQVGSGSGVVTSDPAGINCGLTCTVNLPYGTAITLTAAPEEDSTFRGWLGACGGRGACVISVTAPTNVNAAFSFNYSLPFSDDFESGDGKWTPMVGDWSVVIEDSHVYSQTDVNVQSRSVAGSPTWSDYTIQARVRPMGGAYAALIARYQDEDNYYFMALRASNKVEFKRMFPTGSQGVGSQASANYTFVAGTWYTATFVVSGTTLYGYINGELVHTTTDIFADPLVTGLAGVGTLSSDAEFDDILITSQAPVYTLTVTSVGSGSGSVTSLPKGIQCGVTCTAGFERLTPVTLIATPGAASSFVGWLGACTGNGPCVVTMDAAKSVVAVFSSASQPMLLVNKTGAGSGAVTSVPAGIDCGLTCTAGFAQNTPVTLTATAGAFSAFTGWNGAGCSGTGPCVMAMDTYKNVTATFTLLTYPLTVNKAGNGTGVVTSIPAGISCGPTCTATLGGIVTLTTVANSPAGFVGWDGSGCSSTGLCILAMDAAKDVTATFRVYSTYLPIVMRQIMTVTVPPSYVATWGSDSNSGTYTNPFKTLHKAVSVAVVGQTIYVFTGTHYYSSTITLSKTDGNSVNMYRIWAYPGDSPVIDFSGQIYSTTSRGFAISGSFYHLKGLEIQYAGDNGIYISGSYNIVEQCVLHHNRDSGLQIGLGSSSTNPTGDVAAYNQVINCDSYHNYDPPDGGDADGFACKLSAGKGNVFRGCRAWENSDDGWDVYDTDFPVLIENSWTWHNGDKAIFGYTGAWSGNGNGFKLGGGGSLAANIVRNCVAFDNKYAGTGVKGFDQNNSLAGLTVYNSLAWDNAVNYGFSGQPTDGSHHVLKNNVGFGAVTSNANLASGTEAVANSWNLTVTADAADYSSLDVNLAKAPRQADGSLPNNAFARLVAGSDLIDQGVDVGIPFCPPAPDLGPFEYCP